MKPTYSENLVDKFQSRSATVGVIGLGYVGLPLSLRFVEVGFKVIGFDIDQKKVDCLNAGQSYVKHIVDAVVFEAVESGFRSTSNFLHVCECDALVICVPTPLNTKKEPDLRFITGTMDEILPNLQKGQLLSLESTTYPGTTEEVLLPYLELNKGFSVGDDFFLAYSPEREDPGNADFSTATIPKICGGYTEACLNVAKALYSQAIDTVVPVSSTKVAEMAKLLENIHRAVNIGLVNEMKILADGMGINIYEVIDAAKTKPFGFTAYYPGPGLGGHCIPIDPFYLSWKAKQYGLDAQFIRLAGDINTAMPQWVVDKTIQALSSVSKGVDQSSILILGIAYKKNIDDMRESPAAELIKLFQNLGAAVSYSDPYVTDFPKMRKYDFKLHSIVLNEKTLSGFDLVLLATDHDEFDYELISKYSKLLVDTRGRYASHPQPHIFPA